MRKIKKGKKKIVFLIFILLILIVAALIYLLAQLPIKNIYIQDNNIVSDQEIIDQAKLTSYPSFLTTTSYSIKKRVKELNFVKDVKIRKNLLLGIHIYITEYKPLFINNETNKIIFEKGLETNNDNKEALPVLTTKIEDENQYKKLIKKFAKVNDSVKEKISEIIYQPTDYDKDRYMLLMNDKNYVCITLTKIENINKYDEMVTKFEGKNGILYLDSGNYFEIK